MNPRRTLWCSSKYSWFMSWGPWESFWNLYTNSSCVLEPRTTTRNLYRLISEIFVTTKKRSLLFGEIIVSFSEKKICKPHQQNLWISVRASWMIKEMIRYSYNCTLKFLCFIIALSCRQVLSTVSTANLSRERHNDRSSPNRSLPVHFKKLQ